jgi:hypothetical protein
MCNTPAATGELCNVAPAASPTRLFRWPGPVLADVLEVTSYQALGRVLVLAGDRGEQRTVLLGGGDDAPVGVHRTKVVQACLVAQSGDAIDQPAIARGRK